MTEEQDNAAEPEKVEERTRKVKHTRKRELEDVRAILATQSGRRFYWRYLSECGVFRSSFTGDTGTYYNEGMRNVGLKLLADMNEADPDAYALMQKEAQ